MDDGQSCNQLEMKYEIISDDNGDGTSNYSVHCAGDGAAIPEFTCFLALKASSFPEEEKVSFEARLMSLHDLSKNIEKAVAVLETNKKGPMEWLRMAFNSVAKTAKHYMEMRRQEEIIDHSYKILSHLLDVKGISPKSKDQMVQGIIEKRATEEQNLGQPTLEA